MDAKFFLLAFLPVIPVAISDEIGWSRGSLWYGWFWISVVWAVGIFGFGVVGYLRALRRK
jgi:hypothetical protein